jgi:hypothetical protein
MGENRRLRSLLTEAIWRLLRWEPGWSRLRPAAGHASRFQP